MNDIFKVMKFTINDMIKRKSFIISTIIILVLIIIGFNIPNIIKNINGDSLGKDKVLVIDRQNIFEGQLALLNESDFEYEIIVGTDTFEEVKNKIENEEIDSSIIVEKQEDTIKIRYIIKNNTMFSEAPDTLINSLNLMYSNLQISKLGLSQEELKTVNPNFEFSIEQTSEEEAEGNIVIIMLMSIVLFYAIYFCAYQVSSSITTEKTSKIMETLVTSTSPKTIILGKTIGIGLVGLGQLVVIITTAVICAKSFIDPEILNAVLDMSNITLYLGFITIIYFILGYFEYALLYALTGSTVSKPEDIQSANQPIAIIALAGFYLAYFTMMNPTSELNSLAAILPISSPFCMPLRIMMGLADGKDAIVSIIILIVAILLIAKIAIKIYSNAILNYGTKLSFKDIIKIYKDKQN